MRSDHGCSFIFGCLSVQKNKKDEILCCVGMVGWVGERKTGKRGLLLVSDEDGDQDADGNHGGDRQDGVVDSSDRGLSVALNLFDLIEPESQAGEVGPVDSEPGFEALLLP